VSGEDLGARWLVTGRVQGVGYRWWALNRGEQLGLRGWVRNLADGRVEVVAAGSGVALAEFETALGQGPRFSRVDNVEKAHISPDAVDTKSFDIR
jgi:acylphosphatase